MEEELSEKEILEKEARGLDALFVEWFADDPDVEFVEAPLDRNPQHGKNTEEEMNV